MKKKGRKAFWHNFKFKYKLTITNENTLEEIVDYTFPNSMVCLYCCLP